MDVLTAPPPVAFAALPPEAPLDMPVQTLDHAPPRPPRPASSPPRMWLRRLVVIGGAILLTIAAAREMHLVLGVNGLTALESVILAVFVSLFAWIALSLVSSLAGFAAMLRRPPPLPAAAEIPRTALLMPAYNEQPGRIMAALAVMHADLVRIGAAAHFDIFILSDTTDPDAWIAEEAAYLALRGHAPDARIHYRRRAKNTERKAGNIADWVRRWGGAYTQFMILDADSVMTGDCILGLARTLAATPDAGLIQSLPVIVGAQTLFARLQQFAGRTYGPMIAHGIAWWHGADGNYWGHNAMIRTEAFASAAGLPSLPGRKPFGGHIMSHDFVEAALIRRAGWAVHLVPGLPGSYEECPPSLTELAVRDRRWCQGNLQHIAVLPTRGLHPISRLHLLMGIGSYITAPLWLLFLVVGILISLQARFVPPDYFPAGPSLFPTWPAVDPVRSMWVFIGTMGMLLGPKLLAWIAAMLHERRAFGGVIRSFTGMLVESVLAGLLAPVSMLTQSASVMTILAGRDGGWAPAAAGGRARAVRGNHAPLHAAHADRPVPRAGIMGGVGAAAALDVARRPGPRSRRAPLAALTARRGAGHALRRIGLLRIPEEAAPPRVLTEVIQLQPLFQQPRHGRRPPVCCR